MLAASSSAPEVEAEVTAGFAAGLAAAMAVAAGLAVAAVGVDLVAVDTAPTVRWEPGGVPKDGFVVVLGWAVVPLAVESTPRTVDGVAPSGVVAAFATGDGASTAIALRAAPAIGKPPVGRGARSAVGEDCALGVVRGTRAEEGPVFAGDPMAGFTVFALVAAAGSFGARAPSGLPVPLGPSVLLGRVAAPGVFAAPKGAGFPSGLAAVAGDGEEGPFTEAGALAPDDVCGAGFDVVAVGRGATGRATDGGGGAVGPALPESA